MRRRLLLLAGCSLVLSLVAGPALAADPAPLGSDRVGRFLDSLADVRKVGEKHDVKTRPTGDPMARAAAPFANVAAEARALGAHDELLATVKSHGFASVEDWAETGNRVVRAAAAVQMAGQAPELEASMAKARRELEASGLPKEQQEAMLKMMESSGQLVRTISDVPEADKKAVEPHLERLKAME